MTHNIVDSLLNALFFLQNTKNRQIMFFSMIMQISEMFLSSSAELQTAREDPNRFYHCVHNHSAYTTLTISGLIQ